MAFISFNNDNTIPQPSSLKEEIIRHVHDRISVTGVQRRFWYADKNQVTLSWNALTQAQYSQLAVYVFNGGAAVAYSNAVTGISFTGFPTTSSDQFLPGASWLKNITVTILEI